MTKYNVDTAENMLRVTLMEPRTAGKTVDVDHEKVVIKCLKMVSVDNSGKNVLLVSIEGTNHTYSRLSWLAKAYCVYMGVRL